MLAWERRGPADNSPAPTAGASRGAGSGPGDGPAIAADQVAVLRAQAEALAAGLPDSVLARSPQELRALANRATAAAERAERRRDRVGERPELAEEPAAEVAAALDELAAAQRLRADEGAARAKRLAVANGFGVVALAGAAGLATVGVPTFSLPVAALVVGGAVAPFAAATVALVSTLTCRRRVGAARARVGAAFARTGFETMGQLAARRLAVDAWDRRRAEADCAEEAAGIEAGRWHQVAGPGLLPGSVDHVVARLRLLRAVQLRLLEAAIREHARRLSPADGVAATAGPAPAPEAPTADRPAVGEGAAAAGDAGSEVPLASAWLGDALDRIRGSHRMASG